MRAYDFKGREARGTEHANSVENRNASSGRPDGVVDLTNLASSGVPGAAGGADRGVDRATQGTPAEDGDDKEGVVDPWGTKSDPTIRVGGRVIPPPSGTTAPNNVRITAEPDGSFVVQADAESTWEPELFYDDVRKAYASIKDKKARHLFVMRAASMFGVAPDTITATQRADSRDGDPSADALVKEAIDQRAESLSNAFSLSQDLAQRGSGDTAERKLNIESQNSSDRKPGLGASDLLRDGDEIFKEYGDDE